MKKVHIMNAITRHCVLPAWWREPMKEKRLVTNEDGYTVIIALAILTLLTVIGISVTTTSTIDIMISGNEKTYTKNFYLAEGAAMQCAQDVDDDVDPMNLPYLNNPMTYDDIRALNFANSASFTITDPESGKVVTPGYAAIYEGVVGSLKMGQPNIHEYSLYGWCNLNNGLVIVELGYRRVF